MAPKQNVIGTKIGGKVTQEASAGAEQNVVFSAIENDLEQKVHSDRLMVRGIGSATGLAAVITLGVTSVIAVLVYLLK